MSEIDIVLLQEPPIRVLATQNVKGIIGMQEIRLRLLSGGVYGAGRGARAPPLAGGSRGGNVDVIAHEERSAQANQVPELLKIDPSFAKLPHNVKGWMAYSLWTKARIIEPGRFPRNPLSNEVDWGTLASSAPSWLTPQLRAECFHNEEPETGPTAAQLSARARGALNTGCGAQQGLEPQQLAQLTAVITASVAAALLARPAPPTPAPSRLPHGWHEYAARGDGARYWANTISGETSWVNPSPMTPPRPSAIPPPRRTPPRG